MLETRRPHLRTSGLTLPPLPHPQILRLIQSCDVWEMFSVQRRNAPCAADLPPVIVPTRMLVQR